MSENPADRQRISENSAKALGANRKDSDEWKRRKEEKRYERERQHYEEKDRLAEKRRAEKIEILTGDIGSTHPLEGGSFTESKLTEFQSLGGNERKLNSVPSSIQEPPLKNKISYPPIPKSTK